MLDLTKPVQTRDGRKARIICTDFNGGDQYRIIALVAEGDHEECLCYLASGHHYTKAGESDVDLVNVTPVEGIPT